MRITEITTTEGPDIIETHGEETFIVRAADITTEMEELQETATTTLTDATLR